jgi:hypothetical protein
VKIHLGIDKEFRAATKAHPGLLVQGLKAIAEACRAGGFQVVDDEPLEGYDRIYVYDPFGNRLELMEKEVGDGRCRGGHPGYFPRCARLEELISAMCPDATAAALIASAVETGASVVEFAVGRATGTGSTSPSRSRRARRSGRRPVVERLVAAPGVVRGQGGHRAGALWRDRGRLGRCFQ